MNINEHLETANQIRKMKLDPTKYIIKARKASMSLSKYIEEFGVK